MHKKFEIKQTKIKGGCQSGRKVVNHNSMNDLPLETFKIIDVLLYLEVLRKFFCVPNILKKNLYLTFICCATGAFVFCAKNINQERSVRYLENIKIQCKFRS